MAGTFAQIRYTTAESVKVRLIQKVQFQKDLAEVEQGEYPEELLAQNIADAETEVENELRTRYAIPFQSKTTGTFQGLPDHTKRALRQVCDLKAVLNVLSESFGDGGVIDGENYLRSMSSRYKKNIDRLLGMDREGEERDRFRNSPPLEDLKLAAGNLADDGVRGTVYGSSNNGLGDYAAGQVNDPALGARFGYNVPGRRRGF